MKDATKRHSGSQPLKPSWAGIASCVLAILMIVMELCLLLAVLVGVKDNQGYMYAASPTLLTLIFGVPTCLALARAGRRQKGHDRRPARLGLVLAFFALAVALLVLFAASLG